MINASLVKQLREMTGAGMMDCKKALIETNGDLEAAVTYLREHGIAKAAKKVGRIAAEGTCNFVVKGNNVIVYEVNSETDFVARNEMFINLVNTIGEILLENNVNNTEEALVAKNANGETIEHMIAEATATIGEKIQLRRVTRLEKTDTQVFGAYSHMNGKIVTVTILEGANDEVAKDVAMHVAAMNPRYVKQEDVDPEEIKKEKEILTQEVINEGRPANIAEKIVAGRIKKFLTDICLVDQAFVKEPDKTVGQYVKENNGEVVTFVRLEVGEGIEKKQEDFAAEVAAQLNK
ncbi:MAG: elongation factor Ts [Acholeplasmataceae bacterium]|nr:elongation factor Ts [Acholeplasmataceae bacterium]